jgi:hypothetical protein
VKEESAVPQFAWILVPLMLAAPQAGAEIFKCVGKNGADLYQNFPCAIESLGSLPSSPAPAKPALRPGDSTQAKPKAARVDVPSNSQPASASEPRVGMTPDEVRAIWGEPAEIVQDEPPSGRVEIWEYGDGKSVRFNATKHRVLLVQR